MLALLRPKQWTKNLLLFAALVFARRLFDPQALWLASGAFVAFCLAASAGYVVNDVIDVERDRLHPDKRLRPVAAGRVSRGQAFGLAGLLVSGALALALWIGAPFFAALLAYLAITASYSLGGKQVAILDTLLIALGFVIRAIAGALAIAVPYSDWFVLCTLFVALFIALSKRRAELLTVGAESGSRPVLAHYTDRSLLAFTTVSMAASVLSYSLYVQALDAASAGQHRLLLLSIPFVIAALFRYFLLVDSGAAGEKPEDTLFRDRPLGCAILGFAIVVFFAFYGGSR